MDTIAEDRKKRLVRDALIVIASVIVAVLIAKSSLIDVVTTGQGTLYILQSFVAGLFFTSAFTTAPAIAILAKLGSAHHPAIVALVGALGSVAGDLIIFYFIRTRVSSDVSFLLSKAKTRRIKHFFERPFARFSLAAVGALVIASPLPDEIGLAMMGLSGMKIRFFVLISYIFNAVGIYAIGVLGAIVSR
jgi:uncharacterized membrane protein YdjX (TVP38/TMEM64 family)